MTQRNAGDRIRELVVALVEEAAARGSQAAVIRRQAMVVSVSAGPPAVVNLKFYGTDPDTFPARYLSSYSPTANDTVWVDFVGPDPIVIGKLA